MSRRHLPKTPTMSAGLLVEQVTALVRWRESVLAMRDAGVDTLVELGAGKVLTGLTKRIDREMTSLNVETPAKMSKPSLKHSLNGKPQYVCISRQKGPRDRCIRRNRRCYRAGNA
jgi:acyl transferase domain-containing protein